MHTARSAAGADDCRLIAASLPLICRTVFYGSGMRNEHPLPDVPLPLNRAARCLSVPPTWLRSEVEAGRLPGLQAGKAILIHVPTVAALLKERAQKGVK